VVNGRADDAGQFKASQRYVVGKNKERNNPVEGKMWRRGGVNLQIRCMKARGKEGKFFNSF